MFLVVCKVSAFPRAIEVIRNLVFVSPSFLDLTFQLNQRDIISD